MDTFLNWILEDPKSRIPVLVAAIAGISVIIGGMFTIMIWPWVKGGIEKGVASITQRFSRRSFEHIYLERVVKEHQYLPVLPTTLVPVTEGHLHELDTLYVALTIAKQNQRAADASIGEAVKKHPHLVILGDPGAGKTTMLRFMALTFARARRGRSSADAPDQMKDRDRIRQAKDRTRREFGFDKSPLPVFVYLNRFREISTWPQERSLLDAIRDELRSVDSLRGMPDTFFEDKLRAGECIFLFDAFDELGTQAARDSAARRIGELAAAAAPGNRFIVSSRIVGYEGQLSTYGFDALTIKNLSWDLIEQLVTRWYTALGDIDSASQLLGACLCNGSLRY